MRLFNVRALKGDTFKTVLDWTEDGEAAKQLFRELRDKDGGGYTEVAIATNLRGTIKRRRFKTAQQRKDIAANLEKAKAEVRGDSKQAKEPSKKK